jgi:hypothetical protein
MRQSGTVAYMSTGGRRCYAGKGDIFVGITPTRSMAQKVALAEREARAILAETEAGTETPIISASASPYSAWGCLAESLAAILPVLEEMEGQAHSD